jgi:hypothetical protein
MKNMTVSPEDSAKKRPQGFGFVGFSRGFFGDVDIGGQKFVV